ncbi:hypothetical protein GCM10017567_58650 [Amycolatopsis bullii]|uniref:Uncharacterized protein n=1 Tax=Amycolatopsis bullii TaxID=941987 RepID=A0ABQ3KKB2_9PSEU|nr:hypothetical protein GCM10017567_58650 [Amycolatopsis bullii]
MRAASLLADALADPHPPSDPPLLRHCGRPPADRPLGTDRIEKLELPSRTGPSRDFR